MRTFNLIDGNRWVIIIFLDKIFNPPQLIQFLKLNKKYNKLILAEIIINNKIVNTKLQVY